MIQGPGRPNPFIAGAAGRCPNCGQGRLFSQFLTVAPQCANCGFDLKSADSGDGPAVFVILIAGFLVCFTALFVEIAYRPPIWLHLSLWLPLATGVCLGLLRPLKGVMVALQFRNDAAEARNDDF